MLLTQNKTKRKKGHSVPIYDFNVVLHLNGLEWMPKQVAHFRFDSIVNHLTLKLCLTKAWCYCLTIIGSVSSWRLNPSPFKSFTIVQPPHAPSRSNNRLLAWANVLKSHSELPREWITRVSFIHRQIIHHNSRIKYSFEKSLPKRWIQPNTKLIKICMKSTFTLFSKMLIVRAVAVATKFTHHKFHNSN